MHLDKMRTDDRSFRGGGGGFQKWKIFFSFLFLIISAFEFLVWFGLALLVWIVDTIISYTY